jgi:hypothetical protein
VREGPEQEQRESKVERQEEGQAVRGEVMWRVRTLATRWVVDEVRDVLDIVLAYLSLE